MHWRACRQALARRLRSTSSSIVGSAQVPTEQPATKGVRELTVWLGREQILLSTALKSDSDVQTALKQLKVRPVEVPALCSHYVIDCGGRVDVKITAKLLAVFKLQVVGFPKSTS
jgi:hypothetical protein